jgi:hypothetical protein
VGAAIRRSCLKQDFIAKFEKSLNITTHKFAMDVITRFNSRFHMLQSFAGRRLSVNAMIDAFKNKPEREQKEVGTEVSHFISEDQILSEAKNNFILTADDWFYADRIPKVSFCFSIFRTCYYPYRMTL